MFRFADYKVSSAEGVPTDGVYNPHRPGASVSLEVAICSAEAYYDGSIELAGSQMTRESTEDVVVGHDHELFPAPLPANSDSEPGRRDKKPRIENCGGNEIRKHCPSSRGDVNDRHATNRLKLLARSVRFASNKHKLVRCG